MEKGQDKKQLILENLIYLIIWLFVLIIPLLVSDNQTDMTWEHTIFFWEMVGLFFMLFLLNNYIYVPYFLNRKKLKLYAFSTLFTIFLFFTAEPLIRNDGRPGPFGPVKTIRPDKQEAPDDLHIWEEFIMPPPGQFMELKSLRRRGPVGFFPVGIGPMINNWVMAILIIGSNLAIKFLFKSIRDDRHLKELEKHNLQTELNYLKAQINPHFFMNTLNNIHALIDLNTEKAKDVVIELSKLMRYVLYDSSYPYVSLKKEIAFLYNYIGLMKIRYTDDVDIQISVPDVIPDVKIAPLLFMTFIENAFKHGISYQSDSYIYAVVAIDNDKLSFMVENSCYSNMFQQQGVGLDNIKKRLHLLYKDSFTLHIEDTAEKYKVLLTIPVTS